MYGHVWVKYITVASKVSCHCSIQVVFYVKQVTLEPIYDSIFSLTYIFDVAPIAFNTVNQIVTLADALGHYVSKFCCLVNSLSSLIGTFLCNICRNLVFYTLYWFCV